VRHERATEELREIAALHALGALTQHEARSFESHVQEGCFACEAEYRKFERAVAMIGFAAKEIAPPEYIRELLLARIEREPQKIPPKAPVEPASEEETMQEFLRPKPATPYLMSQPRSERTNICPWVLVVVMAVLGIAAAYAW
jgi:hypothetical protein